MTKDRFKQADIKRALKGANDAGYFPTSVEVTVDGTIKLLFGEGKNTGFKTDWDKIIHD